MCSLFVHGTQVIMFKFTAELYYGKLYKTSPSLCISNYATGPLVITAHKDSHNEDAGLSWADSTQ